MIGWTHFFRPLVRVQMGMVGSACWSKSTYHMTMMQKRKGLKSTIPFKSIAPVT